MLKPKLISPSLSMKNRSGAPDGARDARRTAADFSTIHTPPSNTGVNHGVSHGDKRKASPKALKTLGDIPRQASSGQFSDASPATDLALRSQLLESVKAIDTSAKILEAALEYLALEKHTTQFVVMAQGLHALSCLRFSYAHSLLIHGVSVPLPPDLIYLPHFGGLQ